MATNPFHIAELITAYLQETLSPEQSAALDQWLEIDNNRQFFIDLSDKNNFRERLAQFEGINAEATWNKTLQLLEQSKNNTTVAEIAEPTTARTNTFRLASYKWIATAAAVLAITFGVWFYKYGKIASIPRNDVAFDTDIAPGKNGATLTLANGKKIYINDVSAGQLAEASGVIISKTADGKIVYTVKEGKDGVIEYNTLETQNGEQTQVVLPDQSVVFLNAASSLRYPSSFGKLKDRRVELSGEGYFEIAKDKAHPFIVKTTNQSVEVLGTHFNVNAYGDEDAVKTTLLEGSVKIASLARNDRQQSSLRGVDPSLSSGQAVRQSSVTLKPGQLASNYGNSIIVTEAITELETAWVKNDFYFRGESLENVMRDIARWYNVKITYTDQEIKTIPLIGQISRTKPLSAVLERIASAGRARFKIEGRQVTVMPDN
ncbi:MAG: FecR domain-containing protein [Bacteroidota bacterium]